MAISIDKYVDINSASSGAGSGDSVPEGSSDIQLFRDPASGRYFTPSEYVGTVEKRADGKYYADGAEANVVTYQTSVTGGVAFSGPNGKQVGVSTNFYPAQYKSIMDIDDTASVQAAINAATAYGGGSVVLDAKRYYISAALVIDGACSIIGAGAFGVHGSVTVEFQTMNVPWVEPFVTGTVLVQSAPATDVIQISSVAESVHIKGIGIMFADDIAFKNTGHGIAVTPKARGTVWDSGMFDSDWDNIIVFGHDGSHYALVHRNTLYCTIGSLHSFGGGGFLFEEFVDQNLQYGNLEFAHAHIEVICAGSAHGVHLRPITTQSVYSYPNLFHFGRLQVSVQNIGTMIGGKYPVTPATSAQNNFNGNVPLVVIDQPDFESNVGSGWVSATPNKGGLTIGVGGSVTQNLGYPKNLFPIETGSDTLFGNRQRFNDLSVRLSKIEPSGSKFLLTAGAEQMGPQYASDGSRTFSVPGALELSAGPSGLRYSGYTPKLGSTLFDTTLSKPVYYGSSGWVDGAGAAVSAPSAGSTAASDTFVRAANTASLGQSTGGQQWTQYCASGTSTIGTNGTQAQCSAVNFSSANYAWLFTNNADGTLNATFATAGGQPGLVFRVSDHRNFWQLDKNKLSKVVDGVQTTVLASLSTAFASGDVAQVVLSGPSITVKRNGSTVGTATDSFNATATGYGIYFYGDNASRITAFSVTLP